MVFFLPGSHWGTCFVHPLSCLSPVPPVPLTTAASGNLRRRKGEGAGTADALSALDLLLGRLAEWADGGGRKKGIVSAPWHLW